MILIANGADVDAQNHQNKKPSDVANNYAIKMLLLQEEENKKCYPVFERAISNIVDNDNVDDVDMGEIYDFHYDQNDTDGYHVIRRMEQEEDRDEMDDHDTGGDDYNVDDYEEERETWCKGMWGGEDEGEGIVYLCPTIVEVVYTYNYLVIELSILWYLSYQ